MSGTLAYGLWSVMIGANEFSTADIAFIVGLLFFFLKIISQSFELLLGVRQRVVASVICGAVFLALCATEMFWTHSKRKRSEALHIAVRTALQSNLEPATAVFFQDIGRQRATPVNLVVLLTITNGSNEPLWLRSVDVEYKTSWWRWKQLIALPDSNAILYLGSETSEMHRVLLAASSVGEVSAGPVEANRPYEAFGLFQYPPDFDSSAVLRVKVCDLAANCSLTNLPTDTTHSANVVGLKETILSQKTDLTNYQLVRWADR